MKKLTDRFEDVEVKRTLYNLQTLEDIALHLKNMLNVGHSAQPIPVEIEGKSAEQLKLELDSLSNYAEQGITYYKEKVQELEALLDKPIDLTFPLAVQNATRIISDIQRIGKSIELSMEAAKELNDAYRQRRREASAQIDNLKNQISNLRNRFLGGLRFKRQIKDLNSKINTLNDFFRTQYDCERLPTFFYSENKRFEDAIGKVFGRFANELFDQYKTLSKRLSENVSQRMNPELFESLIDDYISKYKSEIEKELEANKKRNDSYGRKAVAVLGNPKKVNKALSVLREGLNQYSSWNDSDEYRKRAKSLNNRVRALPNELRSIVERGIRGGKTINEEFAEFGKYLTQFPILTSFSKAMKNVLSELSRDDLPYSITSQRFDLERTARDIEESLSLGDYLKKLDMEKWGIFRNNVGVKQLYGREALESFNQLIRDEVFNRLLVTPGTDESVSLGSLWFKDPNAVAYNLLNFWREPCYLGEYVTSLTEEQLRAVEQLRIPGLTDLINTIRQHPNTFTKPHLEEGGEWIDNPVYERVQEALGKVCCHYLEKGSDKEKYFAVTTATKLGLRFLDKPSQQRDKLIEVLSQLIGLDEHIQANFKKHCRHFLDRLGGARGMTDLQQYKEDLVAISRYYDDLEALLAECANPNRVREEASSMQNDYNYIYKVERDLPKLIAYLRGFDSEMVQTQLADPKYARIFETRLWKVKGQIFRSKASIDDITKYIIADFTALRGFIDTNNELIERSTIDDILKSEQERILNSLVDRDDIARETAYIPEYFKALDNNETARKFAGKDVQTKINLEFLARRAYNCNESLVVPLTREAIRRDVSYEQLSQIQNYLQKIAEFPGFVNAYTSEKDNQDVLFDLLYELSTMGEDSLKLVSKIDKGDLDFTSTQGSIKKLNQSGIRPTSYLVERLVSAENRDEAIKEWLGVMDSFNDGYFDADNELHRNLEYTRFRAIVDHEKVRRYMKNRFTITDYLSIFDRPKEAPESMMTNKDKFEIDCVAEEAKVLRDYVLSVKQRADELGKEVFLVPNLSYGYLPVSPIVEELEHRGVNVIIGVKVGSTESHNNKEVINSGLFEEYKTKIANEQPIIIVVDGTTNLVARDDQDKAARYPDAYQGYLNQVVAINDAMGFTEVDYSNAGKSAEDMARLRQTSEFQKLVDVYKHIIKLDTERERKPYQFCLWNTAGLDLIIRNYHRRVAPTTPEDIQGPAMIFCNVGLLDEQISQELKDKYPGLIHTPAYFDDSEKIINLDFGFDNFGVRYLNTLETEIKKAFGSPYKPNRDYSPLLIKYVQNVQSQLDMRIKDIKN